MLGLAPLDWVAIGGYFFGITWLGLWTMSKIKSTGDYFMGGRRFGKLMMIAQAFGVGTHTDQPVSVSGASYTNGLAGIWYQWVYMFATPFFWLIAPIYRRLRYVTMADFFAERYGRPMAILYGTVALLYFAMNMGIMLKGTAVTVEGLTGGALREQWIIVICTVLFVSYGLAGGIVAAVYTDLVQGILILFLSFAMIPFALYQAGGIGEIKAGLPEAMFSLVAAEEVTLYFIVMAVINALVSVVALPHHMAIGGSGKTEIACRAGWTFGNFLKRFATAGWAFIGIFALFLFPELIGENREMTFGIAARELLPVGLVGLMLAAMLAAVMSTCDAFMVHASALVTHNFYGTYINPNANERQLLKVGRFAAGLVVVGGLAFAYLFPSVIGGIKESWKVMAYLGISFWLGVMWRRANRWGALASVISMFAVSMYTQHGLGWGFAAQVSAYLPTGIVAFTLVSVLTPAEPKDKLDVFYALLQTPVGQEKSLREQGFDIKLAGELDNAQTPKKEGPDDGLILVDLFRIFNTFSWPRYRTDILGFLAACGVAAVTVATVFWIANA